MRYPLPRVRGKSTDAVLLVAAPLLIAAFTIQSVVWPVICLTLAEALVVYTIAGHDELAWKHRIPVCAGVFAVGTSLIAYVYRANLTRERRERVAPLVAAALPSPLSSNCPIPRGAVGLYLGNRTAVITRFPHVIFRAHGKDVLVIDRAGDELVVSFQVFDDRGDLVGSIQQNSFTALNPAAHAQRPNAGNLVLFDDRQNKVLDVHFLNPQAVRIEGVLRYPGVEPIVIAEKYAGKAGSILPPACITGDAPEFGID